MRVLQIAAAFSHFLLVRSPSLVSESRNEPGATSQVGHIQPGNSKNHPEDPEHTDLFLWVSIEGADPLSACHTDIQDLTDLQSKHAMFIREASQSCSLNNFYYLADLKSNSLDLRTQILENRLKASELRNVK